MGMAWQGDGPGALLPTSTPAPGLVGREGGGQRQAVAVSHFAHGGIIEVLCAWVGVAPTNWCATLNTHGNEAQSPLWATPGQEGFDQ